MNAQTKACSQLTAISFLVFLLAPLPPLAQDMKVPVVICTAMGAKTVYMPATRENCPLCLFFANSPLCMLVMKLLA